MANQPKGVWVKSHYISTSIRGRWSKYGGGRQTQYMEMDDRWWCQVCRRPQYSVMPQYRLPLEKEAQEYVRICGVCKNVSVVHHLVVFPELSFAMRVPDVLRDFRMSLPTISYPL